MYRLPLLPRACFSASAAMTDLVYPETAAFMVMHAGRFRADAAAHRSWFPR